MHLHLPSDTGRTEIALYILYTVGFLPCSIEIFTAKVPVCGKLSVNRTAKPEGLNNGCGTQIKQL